MKPTIGFCAVPPQQHPPFHTPGRALRAPRASNFRSPTMMRSEQTFICLTHLGLHLLLVLPLMKPDLNFRNRAVEGTRAGSEMMELMKLPKKFVN